MIGILVLLWKCDVNLPPPKMSEEEERAMLKVEIGLYERLLIR